MQLFGPRVRFGVQLTTSRWPFTDYAAAWERCEDLGYDVAYATDHLVLAGPDGGPLSVLEGTTLLAAMAARTTTMRCGFMVLGNTIRNPGLVAKIAVTLDHISHGRLELGLGAGNGELEHAQYGIPFFGPGKRLEMLAESVKIIRLLLTEEETNFQGRFYSLSGAFCEPKPAQTQLPILVGAIGEQIGLRVAAESADIWNVWDSPSPEVYRQRSSALEKHCREMGRNPSDIRRSFHIKCLLGESEEEIRERSAKEPRARWRGTPDRLVEELLGLVRLGVADFVFMLDHPGDFRSLELLIQKVAPVLRSDGAKILAAHAV